MLQSAGVQTLRRALYLVNYLGYTQRSRRFNRASQYYWGKQYDHLDDWQDDKPLEEKAPKVKMRLTKSAVDQVNAHLFGEGRKPSFEIESLPNEASAGDTDDEAEEGESDEGGDESERLSELNQMLTKLEDDSRLRAQLPELGRLGNLHGTVAVGFHLVDGRFDIEVLHAADAYPTFGYDDRQRAAELGVDFDDLLELDEYWREVDESIDGRETYRLHRRTWGPDRTVEYQPIELEGSEIEDARELDWQVDEGRTVQHDLGFVPVEWIQNIPVAHDWDGRPAVDEAEFELEDEINYTLSQTGRGIRYNQEPQVVFTDVQGLDRGGPVQRGSKETIALESGMESSASAELLEMDGTGAERALAYVDKLRSFFREVTQTVQHDPEQFAGALSGTALKRLLRPLVALVGLERPQYGEALSRLLEKMLKAETGTWHDVTVAWPEVVELTASEMAQVVKVARDALNAGIVTKRTAVQLIAPLVGIDDVDSYLETLEEEAGTEQAGGTQSVAEQAFQEAEQNFQDL
jgi:hypothetical protein